MAGLLLGVPATCVPAPVGATDVDVVPDLEAKTGAPAVEATTRALAARCAARTAARRRDPDESAPACALVRTRAGADSWLSSCGQPRKETTALASTNTNAAPAKSEPAVPKPAI